MSTTILTRQKVEEIATVVYEKDHFTPTDEVWCNLYWLTKFARAIEQAVLQSEQVQAWKKDAERLDWLADPNNSIGNVQLPTKCVTENLHCLRAAIDAAIRSAP